MVMQKKTSREHQNYCGKWCIIYNQVESRHTYCMHSNKIHFSRSTYFVSTLICHFIRCTFLIRLTLYNKNMYYYISHYTNNIEWCSFCRSFLMMDKVEGCCQIVYSARCDTISNCVPALKKKKVDNLKISRRLTALDFWVFRPTQPLWF